MSAASHVVARPERIWPSVKVLLEQYGLTSAQIKATGNRGQLLKSDVLDFLKHPRPIAQAATPVPIAAVQPAWQPPPPPQLAKTLSKFIDLPNAALKQQLAYRMAYSKSQVPHSYASIKCSADRFTKAVSEMNVSRQSALVKIVTATIRQFPSLNAHFVAAGDTVRLLSNIDMELVSSIDYRLPTPKIASESSASASANAKPKDAAKSKAKVGEQAATGKQKDASSNKVVKEAKTERRHVRLVLRNAERKSATDLQAEIDANLANASHTDSSNSPGSFTLVCFLDDDVTVSAQRPIIGVPQVACLAVSLNRSLVIPASPKAAVTTCSTLNATLSFDVRAVDEVTASEFLAALKQRMEFVI